jgi:hypothetical protein
VGLGAAGVSVRPAGVDPAAWLSGHGWTPGQVTTVTELGSRRGRPAPPEFARASAPRVWLFDGASELR